MLMKILREVDFIQIFYKITNVPKIIVKSVQPNGLYKKVFNLDISDYEKFSDLAMEAMTRAVEEVIQECKKKSGSDSTTSRAFCKHFFSYFGPLIWAFEKKNEENIDNHYTTLTELALRNAGYGRLSLIVNKCTEKLNKEIERRQDEADEIECDFDEFDSEDDDEEIF